MAGESRVDPACGGVGQQASLPEARVMRREQGRSREEEAGGIADLDAANRPSLARAQSRSRGTDGGALA